MQPVAPAFKTFKSYNLLTVRKASEVFNQPTQNRVLTVCLLTVYCFEFKGLEGEGTPDLSVQTTRYYAYYAYYAYYRSITLVLRVLRVLRMYYMYYVCITVITYVLRMYYACITHVLCAAL